MLDGWLSVISMGKGNKNSPGFSYITLCEGYRDVNIDDSLDGISLGFSKVLMMSSLVIYVIELHTYFQT